MHQVFVDMLLEIIDLVYLWIVLVVDKVGHEVDGF